MKWVAIIAVVMMYLVLISGALVTTTGSGQGCGRRWPLCDKEYWNAEAIIEFFGHRGVTGLATIFVVALCYMAWRYMPRRPVVRSLIWLALSFLVIQALLGAGNVVWPQPKLLLALHFGISLISFASVLLLAVFVLREGSDRQRVLPHVPASFRRSVWYITGLVFVIVYFGAYIRHIGAGLACSGWPLCNGELLPALNGPVGANFLHRISAAAGFLWLARIAWLSSGLHGRPDVQRGTWAAFLLMTLQVLSGAVLAVGHYGLWTQMLHGALLVALFGLLSYLSLAVVPVNIPFMSLQNEQRAASAPAQ